MEIRSIDKSRYRRFVNREMKLFFKEGFGSQGMKYWEAFSIKERALRFGAKEKGETLGAVSLHIHGKIARIGAFIVAKDSRGEGIGSNLLKKCEDEAKKNGCIKVWLWTFPKSDASSFYSKHGYKQEALVRKHFNGADLIIMSKFF
jgi:GNAT superfamily N-acetyltransferase